MTRIFCCGQRDRGDDAAGVLVAGRLQALGIRAEVYEGDPLTMISSWNPGDEVIVVDAMVTGAPAGSICVWEGSPPQTVVGATSSSHGLGVAEAIRLAQMLGRLPRRLRLYGIEGSNFQAGAAVSAAVRDAAEEVAGRIAAELVTVFPRRS